MARKPVMSLIALALIWSITGCNTGNAPQATEPEKHGYTVEKGELLAMQLGVPSAWQAKYTSETGISTITMDAEIIVPEAYSVDIIEAIPRPFTDEEIFAFIDRHNEGLVWTDQATRERYDGYGVKKDPQYWNRPGI